MQTAEVLLALGARVCLGNNNGRFAFKIAVQGGKAAIVQTLIRETMHQDSFLSHPLVGATKKV